MKDRAFWEMGWVIWRQAVLGRKGLSVPLMGLSLSGVSPWVGYSCVFLA